MDHFWGEGDLEQRTESSQNRKSNKRLVWYLSPQTGPGPHNLDVRLNGTIRNRTKKYFGKLMVGKTGDQIKNQRRFRKSEAEQGSGGYVAPRRVAEPHRRRWDRSYVQATGRRENRSGILDSKATIQTMTHYACRSVRPRQEPANRFEFLGKKIRIPTRGWARTASPEQADKRGNPNCRRPTSTFGSMER